MFTDLNETQREIMAKTAHVSALLREMEDLQLKLLALQVEVQFEQEALKDLLDNNRYLARDLKKFP